MATLSISGDNSSYKITLSGMSTSTRYHVFVADLSASGTVTGYKCVRSSLGSSSPWTYSGSSNSPYSGYARSVYVYTSTAATSHSVGTIYTADEMRNGCTYMDSDSIPAAGGSSGSYKIKVVLGDGILQVSYRANSSSLGSNPNVASSDFTVDVGQGGYLYIGIARMDENYTYPVMASASSGTSSWTVVKADGTYNDQKISAPSSSGTRTVTLTATPDIKYYYKVHAFANGGYFSNASETDYYTLLGTSRTVSIDFDCSQLTTPKRAGYTFLGWGYSSNATQYYTDTITISATSQSSTNPTIYNLYAIWTQTEYTAYVKLGTGIASAAVYVDGALKSDIRDKVYHAVSVNLMSTVSIKSIAKETGYEVPYTVSFYDSASASSPSSSFESSDSEVAYSYTGSRVYAVLSAKKSSIDLFYWDSATWDAANIKTGQPISNLTAARWNRFKSKIQELAEAEGGAYSYASVVSGGTIYATEFNDVRTAITGCSGYGTLPAAQSKGDTVKAALFEGNGSLKSALNAAITHYNNS